MILQFPSADERLRIYYNKLKERLNQQRGTK